jgi:hypothetical protein
MQLETRQAQLFMNIFNTFASKEYQKDREHILNVWDWEDFDEFWVIYGYEDNPENYACATPSPRAHVPLDIKLTHFFESYQYGISRAMLYVVFLKSSS